MSIPKAIGICIAGLAVGLLVSALWKTAPSEPVSGGVYNNVSNYFREGLFAGGTNQFSVDANGTLVGATSTVEAFTEGGFVYSTSTSAVTNNLTFRAAEIQNYRYLVINQGRIDQTLTLPATSSITTLVPNSGDVARITVQSATGTVTGFRIAAGTGFTIQTGSTTPATVATTTNGEWATLTFIRKPNTDIDVLWLPFK